MFGRNKGPTPSQMRAMQRDQAAMQQQQAAMNAMSAKMATKEGQARSAAADAEKAAMLAKKSGSSIQTPTSFKPDYTDPVGPRSPMVVQPKTGVLPSKPANAPMEQVEINKAKQLAAIPQPYMPQANTVPNPQMAAMQKMPQPGTVPPANAIPMAPSNPGGPSSGLGSTAQLGSQNIPLMKRGGKVRNKPAAKFSSGGSPSKASSRGDGIAQRGKTKGRYI